MVRSEWKWRLLFLIQMLCCMFLCTHCLGSGSSKSFTVYRIVPRNIEELNILGKMSQKAINQELDFWTYPTEIGEPVELMVSPKLQDSFLDVMTTHNMSFEVSIPDVIKLSEEQEKPESQKNSSILDKLGSFFRRFKEDPIYTPEFPKTKAEFNFLEYATYSQMKTWMRNIQFYYPSFTKIFQMGSTYEGQTIQGIKIGSPISDQKKRAIWIDGGIHAREWAAVNAALFFINELVAKYGIDDEITYYVDSLNFYIVPCLNPDGYEFSHNPTSDPLSYRRMWRKNRARETCTTDTDGRSYCCRGVDLNRNFDFHWEVAAHDQDDTDAFSKNRTSDDPCSDIYKGTRPFSEPETRALRDMLLSPELKGKTDAYITLHTFSQLWLYPFGNKKGSYPDDRADLEAVGRAAVAALEKVYGTKYKMGNSAEILYPASGTSVDWAKASAGIKYTYLVELRPAKGNDAQHTARTGFILQKRELVPCAIETWAGVKVVIEAVLKLHNLQRKPKPTVDFDQDANDTITTSDLPGRATADPFFKRIHLHD